MLPSEAIEQVGVPLAVLLAFVWLVGQTRSDANGARAGTANQPVTVRAVESTLHTGDYSEAGHRGDAGLRKQKSGTRPPRVEEPAVVVSGERGAAVAETSSRSRVRRASANPLVDSDSAVSSDSDSDDDFPLFDYLPPRAPSRGQTPCTSRHGTPRSRSGTPKPFPLKGTPIRKAAQSALVREGTPKGSAREGMPKASGSYSATPKGLAARSGTAKSSKVPRAVLPPVLSPTEVVQKYKRVEANRPCKLGDTTVRVITAWFESSSESLLRHPPDLRAHPKLRGGDLFYHRAGEMYQLWRWMAGPRTGLWTSVWFGHFRDDGLRLTLTARNLHPSWVNEERYEQRLKEIKELQRVAGVIVESEEE